MSYNTHELRVNGRVVACGTREKCRDMAREERQSRRDRVAIRPIERFITTDTRYDRVSL